jgi:hypothetical protein
MLCYEQLYLLPARQHLKNANAIEEVADQEKRSTYRDYIKYSHNGYFLFRKWLDELLMPK